MQKYSVLLVGENTWLIRALWLLIESDPILMVSGACAVSHIMAVSKQLAPDIVLFLPEISLVHTQSVFVELHKLLPQLILILITPVDAGLYEANSVRIPVDGFVFQGSLNTDLLPKIRTLASQVQGRVGKI